MLCHVLYLYAESRYAESRNAESRYAKSHYAECRYNKSHYAECRYAECCNVERCYRYAECCYAEYHGAKFWTRSAAQW